LSSISTPLLTSVQSYFYAHQNALPSSQVNTILAMIVSWGSTPTLTNISIQGQTPPAPPTGTGITNKAILIAAGKTVYTD